MATESGERSLVTATWKQMATLSVAVVLAIGGGFWVLVNHVIAGLDNGIAELRSETGARFAGREGEDVAIRDLIKGTDEMLRVELQASRLETTTALRDLGDRIVASNREIGDQIGQLRTELVSTMENGDGFINNRFDRLEQKVDTLLGRISFEPQIELDPGTTYMIDARGTIFDQESGASVGTLPAVVAPAEADAPKPKP